MDRRVIAAMRMMERGMGENLPIEELASAAGLSLHHFHRLFEAETGEPPASFLRRIRMDAAALRLQWADESTETIAHALGFHSRSAFIRAFERRVGVSPGKYRKNSRGGVEVPPVVQGRQASLREVDSFSLLAKRYVGDPFRVGEYWQDFFACLPADITVPGKGLYVGLLHDDFRVTDPDKVRYDCAITVAAAHSDDDGLLASHGLHLIRTQAGRYATVEHEGHYSDVAATYDFVCIECVIARGFVPGSNPAMELHTVPRHQQCAEELKFTILFPVE